MSPRLIQQDIFFKEYDMSEKKKDKVRQSKPPKTKSSDRTEEIIIESAETKAEEANRPALEIVAENNPAPEASAASLPDTKKPDADPPSKVRNLCIRLFTFATNCHNR